MDHNYSHLPVSASLCVFLCVMLPELLHSIAFVLCVFCGFVGTLKNLCKLFTKVLSGFWGWDD